MTIISREFKIFLTFFIIYSFFIYWSTWDEEAHFATLRAIVEENRFEIDTYHNQTGDKVFHEGHYYSFNSPGLSLISSPIYSVWKHFYYNFLSENFIEKNSGSTEYIIERPTIIRYTDPGVFVLTAMILVTIFTSSLFSSLTVLLVYKISKYFITNESHRLLLTFVTGLGTLIFAYSLAFLGEATASFFAFLSFYFLFKAQQDKKRISNILYIIAGLLVGYSVTIHPIMVVTVVGLLAYCLFNKNCKNGRVCFIVGIFLGALPLLIYNHIIFGNPLGSYQYYISHLRKVLLIHINPEAVTTNSELWALKYNNFIILLRLLFEPTRGLFFHYPILIFSFLGLYFMYKKLKKEALLVTFIFVSYLITNSLYYSWSGGLCFGPRYLIPAIPFLVIPLLFTFKKDNLKFIIPLAILSIFVNFLGLQTLAPFLPSVPTPEQVNELNSLRIFGGQTNGIPLLEHYLRLFLKNGPRSRIFEQILEGDFQIDIRHWSPQFGVEDQYLKVGYPFLCLVPLAIVVFFIWHKEIFWWINIKHKKVIKFNIMNKKKTM